MGDIQPDAELLSLFDESGLAQEDCELVARTFEVSSVKLFCDFFEHPDVHANFKAQMFDHVPEWRQSLGKAPRLRKAWTTACEWERRRLGGVAAMGDVDLDTPIGIRQHDTLRQSFTLKHGFTVPTSWVWTDPVLGRTYRSFHLRRTDQGPCGRTQIWATSDEVLTIVSQSQGTSRQLMPGVSLTAGQPAAPKPKPVMQIYDCWQYLKGLDYWAFSTAIAGCFKIEQTYEESPGARKSRSVYMVELDDLLKHVAFAGGFVMKHLTKNILSKEKTFSELRRHDEAVRAAWGVSFQENHNLSFSQAINLEKNVGFAERQWEEDYSILKQCTTLVLSQKGGGSGAGGGGNSSGKPPHPDTPRRDRKRRSRRRGRSGSRGRRQRSSSKAKLRSRSRRRRERSSSKPKITVQKGKLGDKTVKVMSARAFTGGTIIEYCKMWHGRGECTAKDCKRRHRCDIVTEVDDKGKGRACDKEHKRKDHTGPTIEA